MSKPITSIDLTRLGTELAGAPCWAAKRGHGSFLTFDLGDRVTRVTKRGSREVGAFHLWVYMAEWTLRAGVHEAGSGASPAVIDSVLARFLGLPITTISIDPLVITFGSRDARSIALTPMEDVEDADPLFMLYLPDHRLLKATQSGQFFLGDDREA
jgi:hypothetical protein